MKRDGFFCSHRRPPVQVRPLRQGFHPALLPGVPQEKDPQRHPEVRLQGAPQQALRLRGVRPHGWSSGRAARPPPLASP